MSWYNSSALFASKAETKTKKDKVVAKKAKNEDKKEEKSDKKVEAKKSDEEVEGKKAPEDAPPVNIGWDSHKPVVSSRKC